jgi:hypothetical protein
LLVSKETGLPLFEGVKAAEDLPYTISFAVAHRARINSFNELPKDKRPPRDLWHKPHKLDEFLETIWDTDDKKPTKEYVEFDLGEVE